MSEHVRVRVRAYCECRLRLSSIGKPDDFRASFSHRYAANLLPKSVEDLAASVVAGHLLNTVWTL